MSNQESLYLEVDEEITSAIDKLLELDAQSVAIVVPKRSTLLQSLVNLKLLKKAAADAGKELVLVTTDRTSTHLAGRLGLLVAPALGAQAKVPETTGEAPSAATEVVEEDPTDAPALPVHDNSSPLAGPVMTKRALEPDAPKVAKTKSARIPDFNSFQKRLLWGGGAVALLLLLTLANFFFKSATVTLYVQGEKVATDFDFTVDTAGKSDYEAAIVEGERLEVGHDLTTKVTATGKKDVGTKAKGQMTAYNGYDSTPRSFPAGARFIAPDGKVFTADADFTIPGASVVAGTLAPGSTKVSVTAAQAGDQYNLAPAKYSMPGQPAQVYGQGNQMSGGTSKQVTVVTQGDIDSARQEALDTDKGEGEDDLKKEAGKNKRLIAPSWKVDVAQQQSSPAVDQEAETATLTLKVVYSQLAVPEADFVKMVEAQQLKLIGEQNQIYENGLENAEITAVAGRDETFSLSTEAYGGAKLNTKQLAEDIKGKRFGDAKELAEKQPGVERAEVQIRPSWSTKLPRLGRNIKIELKVDSAGG